MEENQNPTSPIGGEPPRVGAPLVPIAETTSERNARLVNHAKQLILDCLHGDGGVDELRVALQELNEVKTEINPRDALNGIRATLHFALADYADVEDGWAAAAGDLSHAVFNACEQIDALLGITEPADEDTMFKRPLVESDFTVTGNSEGDELPAYELSAELASCDWEGWD